MSKKHIKKIESAGGQVKCVDGEPIAVDLSCNAVSKLVFAAVLELPTLRKLDLGYTTGIRNEWLPQLVKLPNLQQLGLNSTAFNDDGMRLLPDLPGLKTLEFLRTKVTDATFQELARFPKLSKVSSGGSMKITNEALKHLGECPNLTTISLQFETGSAITDEGITHLRGLKKLSSLSLYGTRIAGSGLAALSDSKKLKELMVDDTEIDDKGLRGLSSLVELKSLFLSSTSIGDTGLKHLAKLQKLTLLELYQTDITDKAIKHLLVLNALKKLTVSQTQITSAGIAKLKKALPKTKIIDD